MEPCSLHPEACITDHLLLPLGGRPRSQRKGWVADCPACEAPNKLSIGVADIRKLRVVMHCHAGPGGNGCDDETVRNAALKKKIPERCFPPRSSGRPAPRDPSPLGGAIEQILYEDAANPQRMRLRIGMEIWQCSKAEAARKLGISRATLYRTVSPVRQNPKTQQSHR